MGDQQIHGIANVEYKLWYLMATPAWGSWPGGGGQTYMGPGLWARCRDWEWKGPPTPM